MEERMAEVVPAAPAVEKQEIPKQVCQKCRNEYPLEAFSHAVEGQECVCRRCLAVMGYKV
jgi:ribosomal protein L40E